jgi:haloalkane dehalogenase
VLVDRKLSDEEMKAYKEPYATYASRYGLRAALNAIPVDGFLKPAHDAMTAYGIWLTQSTIPKLFIKTPARLVIKAAAAKYIEDNLKALPTVDLVKGKHFIQEDFPDEIAAILVKWIGGLPEETITKRVQGVHVCY